MKNKTAYMGLFLAFALICSYVESLIPFYFGVPGIKLGLANLVVVMVMYCIGGKEALGLSALRILLAGFLFGNMFSIFYSFAGGLLSFAIMALLKKTGKFRVVSVSVAGGISHNIGQLLAAALVVSDYHIFYYGTVLVLAGAITGLLIGILSQEVIARLDRWIHF